MSVLDNGSASIEDKLLLPESLQSPVGADLGKNRLPARSNFNA